MTFSRTARRRMCILLLIILLADNVRLHPIPSSVQEMISDFWLGYEATKKRPSLLAHPIIKEVAGHYPDATPAHVLLNWGLTRGYSVIPKSITPGALPPWPQRNRGWVKLTGIVLLDRIRSNMREMTLSPEDTQKINSIVKTESQR